MIRSNLAIFITPLLLIVFCNQPLKAARPQPGLWKMYFRTGDTSIPVRLRIDDAGKWTILNSEERIVLDSVVDTDSGFHVKLPLYNSVIDVTMVAENTMQGVWKDLSRGSEYQIPFEAFMAAPHNSTAPVTVQSDIYEVTFSPVSKTDKPNAVALLTLENTRMTGTFLTESGDYRFLEGEKTDDQFYLSCFDGTHLFYFTGEFKSDSIVNGHFYSGNHWHETWIGRENKSASLRDPDSLTFALSNINSLDFRVLSMSGDSVTFDSTDFTGRVSIVQIFGSWCPNCTDESRFFKRLYEKYHADGLQIIPVAFERSTSFEENKKNVTAQFSQLGLTYPSYFGGRSSKSEASKTFAGLSGIKSYPTAIFIDKKGKIRKIHTGFYGPGTGKYYIHHTEILDMFVRQLLAE